MIIPIGGVWRPGDSDLEDEPDTFFGQQKPEPDPKPSANESNFRQIFRYWTF